MIDIQQLIYMKIIEIIEQASYICVQHNKDIRAMTQDFNTHFLISVLWTPQSCEVTVWNMTLPYMNPGAVEYSFHPSKYTIIYDKGESYTNCFNSIRSMLIGNCLAKTA